MNPVGTYQKNNRFVISYSLPEFKLPVGMKGVLTG